MYGDGVIGRLGGMLVLDGLQPLFPARRATEKEGERGNARCIRGSAVHTKEIEDITHQFCLNYIDIHSLDLMPTPPSNHNSAYHQPCQPPPSSSPVSPYPPTLTPNPSPNPAMAVISVKES